MAPQTIFFKNQYGEEIKRFKKIVQKHKLLYIIAREMNTFLFLQKEFQMPINEKLFYLPDFVLTLSLKKTEYKRKGMAICLRSDGESDLPMQDINNNKRSVDLDESRVYEIVMAKDHIEIPEWLRNKFLKRKFSEYYKRKIVVTDRLHGMIFAAITGTPCVALDNLSHKVSGVYQSIRGLSYIELAKDVSQIDELAWKVMQVPDDVKEKELEELQKWIMKKYRRLFRNLIYKG